MKMLPTTRIRSTVFTQFLALSQIISDSLVPLIYLFIYLFLIGEREGEGVEQQTGREILNALLDHS